MARPGRHQADGGLFKSLFKSAIGRSKYHVPVALAQSSDLAKRSRLENWNVWSLEGGLENLTEALRDSVESRGVEVRTGQEVKSVTFSDNKAVINNNPELQFDHVFSNIPATSASKILSSHSKLSALLGNIPYVDVGVVNVEFDGQIDLPCGPGFGILVPSSQTDIQVLGIIFDTCMFPQGDRTIFTVMMGGRWFESLFGASPSEEDLALVAVEHVQKMLGISDEPARICTKIHRDAIAQYTVGHGVRLRSGH